MTYLCEKCGEKLKESDQYALVKKEGEDADNRIEETTYFCPSYICENYKKLIGKNN